MTEQQFALLMEKLDQIRVEIELMSSRQLELSNYPTRVEIVEKQRPWR